MTTIPPTRILPFLYLGNHKNAKNKSDLIKIAVTHIIALGDNLKAAFEEAKKKDKSMFYEYFVLDIKDNSQDDLFPHLNKLVDFIFEGKKEGSILVHCPTGNNRAAAVCMAYLIKYCKMSLSDAEEVVQDARTTVSITPGIKSQLQKFYDSLNPPEIKKTETLIDANQSESPNIETKEQNEKEKEKNQLKSYEFENKIHQNEATMNYSCKNCRTPLFSNLDIAPHEMGSGQDEFSWRKRGGDSNTECTSIFLGEMAWMGTCNEIEGKLQCPKCKAKIGSWAWAGTQCSCGAWCTPAFQISKARVDLKWKNYTTISSREAAEKDVV